MAGKKLKHGHGVSFLALEKQIPIVVTSRDVANEESDGNSYFKGSGTLRTSRLKLASGRLLLFRLGISAFSRWTTWNHMNRSPKSSSQNWEWSISYVKLGKVSLRSSPSFGSELFKSASFFVTRLWSA